MDTGALQVRGDSNAQGRQAFRKSRKEPSTAANSESAEPVPVARTELPVAVRQQTRLALIRARAAAYPAADARHPATCRILPLRADSDGDGLTNGEVCAHPQRPAPCRPRPSILPRYARHPFLPRRVCGARGALFSTAPPTSGNLLLRLTSGGISPHAGIGRPVLHVGCRRHCGGPPAAERHATHLPDLSPGVRQQPVTVSCAGVGVLPLE